MPMPSPKNIDACFPQTQCGLCGYGGCMPYAEAIAFKNAPLNLCTPGGVATLQSLGELLQQDITPYIDEMQQKTKPPMRAVIREPECIGCTKCIQACPVDAILGSAKSMHTIIASECTGCELCIPPCPVDCIDMVLLNESPSKTKADYFRNRFNARNERLANEKRAKKRAHAASDAQITQRQLYIQAAIDRVKKKKG